MTPRTVAPGWGHPLRSRLIARHLDGWLAGRHAHHVADVVASLPVTVRPYSRFAARVEGSYAALSSAIDATASAGWDVLDRRHSRFGTTTHHPYILVRLHRPASVPSWHPSYWRDRARARLAGEAGTTRTYLADGLAVSVIRQGPGAPLLDTGTTTVRDEPDVGHPRWRRALTFDVIVARLPQRSDRPRHLLRPNPTAASGYAVAVGPLATATRARPLWTEPHRWGPAAHMWAQRKIASNVYGVSILLYDRTGWRAAEALRDALLCKACAAPIRTTCLGTPEQRGPWCGRRRQPCDTWRTAYVAPMTECAVDIAATRPTTRPDAETALRDALDRGLVPKGYAFGPLPPPLLSIDPDALAAFQARIASAFGAMAERFRDLPTIQPAVRVPPHFRPGPGAIAVGRAVVDAVDPETLRRIRATRDQIIRDAADAARRGDDA